MSRDPLPARSYQFSHRSDIQGLRGIAVILVLLYHAQALIQGGYVGVDVFFVISGFVISAGIFRELDRREGKFSFRSFYERRMRRLLPSLAVTVSLTLALGILFAPYSSLKFMRRTGVAATFFNANHYLLRGIDYFAPAAERNALLHTWSLSVEEQFYFVFPVLFVLAATMAIARKKPPYRTVALVMGGVFALSLGAELYCSYGTSTVWGVSSAQLAFFGAPLRAWEFGVGVLIATALPWLQRIDQPVLRLVLLVGGLIMIFASSFLYSEATIFPGVAALVPVLGSGLVLLAGSFSASSPLPFVSNQMLTRAGDLSYGWYLWHWPPLVFIQASWPGDPFIPMLCTLALSLVLAWLNERLVEKPMRHAAWVKRKYANVLILAACFGFPVLAFFFQKIMVAQLQTNSASIATMEKLEKQYEAIGCDYHAYNGEQKTCRWGDSGSAWRVVLVGDSNARQFIPALRETVPALGGEFHAATFNRCLFSDLHMRRHGSVVKGCTTWMRDTLTALDAHPPDLVLISSSYDAYLAEDEWSFEDQESGEVYTTRSERIEALQRSTQRLSQRLVAAGSHVVFIKNIPKYKSHASFVRGEVDLGVSFGADCALFKLLYFPDSCNATRPLLQSTPPQWVDVNYGREAYRTALGDRVSELVVDDALCPGGICRAKQGDLWVYRDTGHISPEGARLTMPIFERFLEAHRP